MVLVGNRGSHRGAEEMSLECGECERDVDRHADECSRNPKNKKKGRERHMMNQDEFDSTIGRLDHCISLLVLASREESGHTLANRQTLKHHAEDMVAAGNKILSNLKLDCSGDIWDGSTLTMKEATKLCGYGEKKG
jgi:hypothetical protein